MEEIPPYKVLDCPRKWTMAQIASSLGQSLSQNSFDTREWFQNFMTKISKGHEGQALYTRVVAKEELSMLQSLILSKDLKIWRRKEKNSCLFIWKLWIKISCRSRFNVCPMCKLNSRQEQTDGNVLWMRNSLSKFKKKPSRDLMLLVEDM
jgi:hypothetical protein